MIEQTKETMSNLKLYGMRHALDVRIHEGMTQGWSGSELISALITDEKLYRDDKSIKRRIKTAQFRIEASLERFDFAVKRTISKEQVRELRTLQFLSVPRNVLIMGPTGVGKTYLATAIGNHACHEGHSVLFIGMNLFIEKTLVSRTDGTFLRFREKMIKADLLIIDDLGIKKLPTSAVQDFYDILEERYQSRATIITTQLPITNWREVIEDQIALEAIVDRLIHGSIKLEMDGESYRKKRGISKVVDKKVKEDEK